MSVYEKRASAPWSATANSWQYTTIYDLTGDPICRLDLEDWGVTEDNQAQLEMEQARIAALITAAPEMLAALQGFNLKEEWIVSGSADSLTIRIPIAVLTQVAEAVRKATTP